MRKKIITGGIAFYDQIDNPAAPPRENDSAGFVYDFKETPADNYVKKRRKKPIITGDPEA